MGMSPKAQFITEIRMLTTPTESFFMEAIWCIIFHINYIEYVEIRKKIEKNGRKRVGFPSNRSTG